MAEFVTVMHGYTRMCDRNMRCESCPIGKANDGSGIACHSFMRQFPEEAESIIMQWTEKNPIVTNRRKFKEIFGFDVATVFEINRDNGEWLDEEYKGDDGNE